MFDYTNFVTLNLELFGTVSSGANATVSQGSMGALDAEGHYAYPNQDLTPEMKTYYDKTLIQEASAALIHDQFAQKRPIPKGSGKTIEFRKFQPLGKALTPISEGVTPNGNTLHVTALTATVEQYGDYVVTSDVLDMVAIDPIITETTKLLGRQAGLTLDTVTRNVLLTGMNAFFSSKWSGTTETKVTKREELDKTATLKVKDFQRAYTMLRAQNAPTIDGSYVALVNPYSMYEVMRDPEWAEWSKYTTPEHMFNGEIGKIANIRCVDSTEAKIWAPAIAIDDSGVRYGAVTVAADTTSSTSVTIDEVLPSATGLTIPVVIGESENTITAITTSGSTTTLTLGTAASLSDGDKIVADGGSSDGSAVGATIVLARDAFGVTEITGGGLQMIVKQLGYGDDPLNQRASCGWKAMKTAEILIPQYIVRIESALDEFSSAAIEN